MTMRIWLILLALVPVVYAEDQDFDAKFGSAGGTPDADEILIENGTMVTGKVRSIDLAARNIIISGYEYDLGSAAGTDRCVVKMLGRDVGAVELLAENMFVQVYYIQETERRLARLIIQTEAGEEF